MIDTSQMSDEELADTTHELNDELGRRCQGLQGGWLSRQPEAARFTVRSRSTAYQEASKGFLGDPE